MNSVLTVAHSGVFGFDAHAVESLRKPNPDTQCTTHFHDNTY